MLDYCPPVDLELGEYLRALRTTIWVPQRPLGLSRGADRCPSGCAAFLPAICGQPVRGKPALAVLGAFGKWIPGLNFANLQFEGDPASPAARRAAKTGASARSRTRRPAQSHAVRACTRWLPGTGDDTVSLPRVQSVLSSRRIGRDGQIIFDLFGGGDAAAPCAIRLARSTSSAAQR